MIQPQVLAETSAQADLATGLAAVAALRRLAERLETLQVVHARDLGWSWQQIAATLGVSKQAVHKKHAARSDASGRPPRRKA